MLSVGILPFRGLYPYIEYAVAKAYSKTNRVLLQNPTRDSLSLAGFGFPRKQPLPTSEFDWGPSRREIVRGSPSNRCVAKSDNAINKPIEHLRRPGSIGYLVTVNLFSTLASSESLN